MLPVEAAGAAHDIDRTAGQLHPRRLCLAASPSRQRGLVVVLGGEEHHLPVLAEVDADDDLGPPVAAVKVQGETGPGRIQEGEAVVRRDEVGDQAAVPDQVAKAGVVGGPRHGVPRSIAGAGGRGRGGPAEGVLKEGGLVARSEEALLDLLGEAVVRDVQARHAPGISDYAHHPHKDTANVGTQDVPQKDTQKVRSKRRSARQFGLFVCTSSTDVLINR